MELIRKLGVKKANVGESFQSYGLFLCLYCKKEVEKQLGNGKAQQSCGCATHIVISRLKTKHEIWHGMKRRCKYLKSKYYQQKGISVCAEWQSYIPFRDWALKNGYKNDLQIDRIELSVGNSSRKY